MKEFIHEIKSILADLWALLVELFLLVVGILAFMLLSVVGFIYTAFKHLVVKRDYAIKRQLLPIIRSLTLSIDGFANASGGELLNDILKVEPMKRVRYGKWYQTISSVTGLLKMFYSKDNWFRKTIDFVLGENHCVSSITEEEKYYYGINKDATSEL